MNDLLSLTMRSGNNWGTGILITDEKDRVLLGLRTDTKNWSAPGGKVEVGESALEGVRRETLEECGITLGDIKFLGVKVATFGNGKVWVNYLFSAKVPSHSIVTPQPSEFHEFKWVSKREISSMDLFEPCIILLTEGGYLKDEKNNML